MQDMTNLFKVAKFQDALVENQDLIDSNNSNASCHEGFSIYPNEVTNKLEQEYYFRASGCSVKAQKDNLFDYKSLIKI